MSDIKKNYVDRSILVKTTKAINTTIYTNTKTNTKSNTNTKIQKTKKYPDLWYIIKEKPINIYRDLNIRIIR